MPRFFIKEENIFSENEIRIFGDDASHISRSLRMKCGEKVTLCDFFNFEYDCEISGITEENVILSVISKHPSQTEPDVCVTLYQCLPKGDKLELIIQKSTELGVSKIVLVESKNCITKFDEKSVSKKLERYNKIALEAAKQCGRAKIPEVTGVISFDEALEHMKDGFSLLLYECEDKLSLKEALAGFDKEKHNREISFLVGPEGGLTLDEAQKAKECGIISTGLGKRILRTETAPICALSAIMYETDNLA